MKVYHYQNLSAFKKCTVFDHKNAFKKFLKIRIEKLPKTPDGF